MLKQLTDINHCVILVNSFNCLQNVELKEAINIGIVALLSLLLLLLLLLEVEVVVVVV
jgi:hypothetical protein